MTDDAALTKAMSLAEIAVADMAAEGLTPQQIAIGLAFQLNEQVRQAMPTEATALAFKLSLIAAPKEMQDAAFADVLHRARL